MECRRPPRCPATDQRDGSWPQTRRPIASATQFLFLSILPPRIPRDGHLDLKETSEIGREYPALARLFSTGTRSVLLLLCLPLGTMAIESQANPANDSKIEDPQLIEQIAQPVISVAGIRKLIPGLSVVGAEPRPPWHSLDFDRSRNDTLSSVSSVSSMWILAKQVPRKPEVFRDGVRGHADFGASRFRMHRDAAHARAGLIWFSHKMKSISPAAVPQPTTAVMMGIGLTGLAVAGRRYDA